MLIMSLFLFHLVEYDQDELCCSFFIITTLGIGKQKGDLFKKQEHCKEEFWNLLIQNKILIIIWLKEIRKVLLYCRTPKNSIRRIAMQYVPN